MKKDEIAEGKISKTFQGLGTVTPAMVTQRARELAVINGRSADNVIESDMDQARRELMGKEGLSPKEAAIESLSEAERWDAVPGTPGHKAPTVPAHDEQAESEKLVEEGVAEAEHEQMVEGAKQSAREGS